MVSQPEQLANRVASKILANLSGSPQRRYGGSIRGWRRPRVSSALSPSFAAGSAGAKTVSIASIDGGRYEKAEWIPGRRLNGEEFRFVLCSGNIGMSTVQLYRCD